MISVDTVERISVVSDSMSSSRNGFILTSERLRRGDYDYPGVTGFLSADLRGFAKIHSSKVILRKR